MVSVTRELTSPVKSCRGAFAAIFLTVSSVVIDARGIPEVGAAVVRLGLSLVGPELDGPGMHVLALLIEPLAIQIRNGLGLGAVPVSAAEAVLFQRWARLGLVPVIVGEVDVGTERRVDGAF